MTDFRDIKADQAAEVAAKLRKRIDDAIDVFGDDMAGFAVVVWNGRGDAYTAYSALYGIVSHILMPTFVADALSRNVTVAGFSNTEDSDDD